MIDFKVALQVAIDSVKATPGEGYPEVLSKLMEAQTIFNASAAGANAPLERRDNATPGNIAERRDNTTVDQNRGFNLPKKTA